MKRENGTPKNKKRMNYLEKYHPNSKAYKDLLWKARRGEKLPPTHRDVYDAQLKKTTQKYSAAKQRGDRGKRFKQLRSRMNYLRQKGSYKGWYYFKPDDLEDIPKPGSIEKSKGFLKGYLKKHQKTHYHR